MIDVPDQRDGEAAASAAALNPTVKIEQSEPNQEEETDDGVGQ